MDEDGRIHMNPNFLAQIRQEFPNTMSRILIACDDGTTRSEKAAAAIVEKCGYTQCKVIDGGIDDDAPSRPARRTRPQLYTPTRPNMPRRSVLPHDVAAGAGASSSRPDSESPTCSSRSCSRV